MYDYIIVGAGSAGCVLAARLSADPTVSVLLLEAGPADDAAEIRAPAALNRLFQTEYDWNYLTVPQHRAAGRSIYWPRGKVLGGSSSINAMIYIRGNRHDFQTWRDEYGCTGWGYEDLMPYFRRAEDNSRGVSAYHGTGGPLAVTDPRYKSQACEAFIAAAQEQGAAANNDFNGPRQDGVGWYQLTQRNGQRCSAATAYLHPAMSRPNLTVHTDALVTKVIIEGGQATGVSYLRHGEPETARANAEVILSGGAINSPQLLMLSGVGPAEHLIEHGHRRGGGQPRSRREPQRPPGAAGHLVHAAAPRPVGKGRQREHAALAADPPRPADEQHGGVGRLRPLRTRSARTGPATARTSGTVPKPGPRRPGPARDVGAGRPGRRGQPGADQAAQRRPQAPPGHRPWLPVRRPGRPGAGRGAEDDQGVHDGQADGRDLRERAGSRSRTSARTPSSFSTSGTAW